MKDDTHKVVDMVVLCSVKGTPPDDDDDDDGPTPSCNVNMWTLNTVTNC